MKRVLFRRVILLYLIILSLLLVGIEIYLTTATKDNHLFFVLLTVAFIAAFVLLIQTKRLARTIEEIAAFLREVTAGNFKTRLFLKEEGEIGELAKI